MPIDLGGAFNDGYTLRESIWSLLMAKAKRRLVVVTDPDEIASIERNQWGDLIGVRHSGVWYVEAEPLARWREKRQRDISSQVDNSMKPVSYAHITRAEQ